jgi:hypothetical protein
VLIRLEWKERGFWLECTKEEAAQCVFPFLSNELIAKSHKEANGYKDELLESFGLDTNLRYCFLVSRDVNSIEPFSPMYPFHPMWNAYSPFELCEPKHVASLNEIMGIEVSK